MIAVSFFYNPAFADPKAIRLLLESHRKGLGSVPLTFRSAGPDHRLNREILETDKSISIVDDTPHSPHADLIHLALFEEGRPEGQNRPVLLLDNDVFFFESVVAALPGSLKLLSLTFYARSLMYNEAASAGYPMDMLPAMTQTVSSETAWAVLSCATVGITLLGMWLFARSEYRDDV